VADEEGYKSLSIDLHGHLAGILSLATKAKRRFTQERSQSHYLVPPASAPAKVGKSFLTGQLPHGG
jgi:hypothetical protein